MNETQPMRIGLGGMVGRALPLIVTIGGLGAYPTWHACGGRGVLALVYAAAIVLVVMVASAMVICSFAARGPFRAVQAFFLGSLARVVLCLGLAGALWELADLPPRPLFLWCAVLYVLVIACEAVWLVRALQRDAFAVHLGEISRKRL